MAAATSLAGLPPSLSSSSLSLPSSIQARLTAPPCHVAASAAVPCAQSSTRLITPNRLGGALSSTRRLNSGAHGKLAQNSSKQRLRVGTHCCAAATATDTPTQKEDMTVILKERYPLPKDSSLEVTISRQQGKGDDIVDVVLMLSGTLATSRMLLHWGIASANRNGWKLMREDEWPEGTKNYKERAMQTPFQKGDGVATVRAKLRVQEGDMVQFALKDEADGTWYKAGDINWSLSLLPNNNKSSSSSSSNTSVGSSAVSSNGTTAAPTKQQPKKNLPKVPEELVQVAAYLRWEKTGRQDYDEPTRLAEYEAARLDLQMEILESKVSVEQMASKLLGPPEKRQKSEPVNAPGYHKIERRDWDYNSFINHVDNHKQRSDASSGDDGEKTTVTQQEPTPLEKATEALLAKLGDTLISKRVWTISGISGQVVTISTHNDSNSNSTNVHILCDSSTPLTLHWALKDSSGSGSWVTPPSGTHPKGTDPTQGAASETPLGPIVENFGSLQGVEIKGIGPEYGSLPFVLRDKENGKWLKAGKGGDFEVKLSLGVSGDVVSEGKKDVAIPKSDGRGTAKWMVDAIVEGENEAQKSFMHRFNMAADLLERARGSGDELAAAGLYVWLRLAATRQLVWNRNYNVKPRELSAAQDRLTGGLTSFYRDVVERRELARLMLACVGRGGQGNAGQRIRDEILVIQRNNNAMGGMMEEWHQKLHNNTTPDDVIICQALLAYLDGLDVARYWQVLSEGGVTRERLLSYDRAIHSEPKFGQEQVHGLRRDLTNYLATLKAVHSGADFESAAAACLGYTMHEVKGGQGSSVHVERAPAISSRLESLLSFVTKHRAQDWPVPLMQAIVEARHELRAILLASTPNPRTRDFLYLDLALESQLRASIEGALNKIGTYATGDAMECVGLALENLCLGVDGNTQLVYALKDWRAAMHALDGGDADWALRAKAVADRIKYQLQESAERYHSLLQPSAEYLGSRLGCDGWAVSIFTEEVVRAGAAAPLSGALRAVEGKIREAANLGSWQVISPVEARGRVVVVENLHTVQHHTYDEPTVLVSERVSGEEEVPAGVVAVLTADAPDVLSHVSVRARNAKVCFATCFDDSVLSHLKSLEGRLLAVKPAAGGTDLSYEEVQSVEGGSGQKSGEEEEKKARIRIDKKKFKGRWAVDASEFGPEFVGAKSRNIALLRERVPDWVRVPRSVAIPFGAFEEVLNDPSNKAVKQRISQLSTATKPNNISPTTLADIRAAVMDLQLPASLISALSEACKAASLPFPSKNDGGDGDKNSHTLTLATNAIKGVWASKWNDRAVMSCAKAGISHDDLTMAVLVQEIVPAEYAFVVHTTNPQTNATEELYAEVVAGLGETLVSGLYPGRALSFVANKEDVDSSARVVGYASKGVKLVTGPTLIFRSDSNGEDLEGYAGAGLYDSIPMHESREEAVDYAAERMSTDSGYRGRMLARIAAAGVAVEQTFGAPQDIEGCVVGEDVYLVQTRPQM